MLRPMRTGIALGIGVALVAAIAVWRRYERDPREARDEVPIASSAHAAAPPVAPEPPASLRDSEIDGELALSPDGRFVPTRDALRFFDYFLSATGEEPLAQLRARIEAAIAQRLPPPAARDALALLDRYLAYRAEAEQVASDPRVAASADLERRLQWLRELRRKHFGAALAQTLFGDEERAIEAGIERRRVLTDEALSADEKQRRLEALEATLPPAERAARETATLPARLAEQEKLLRESGGSDGDVRALRDQMVGPEAADRLAALDERRAEWTRRLDAYRAERDPIASNASLDPQAREAALENLRARLFDARERLRVRTIDEVEIGAPPAPPPAD
jgi:lipase chaperone LimK